MPTLIRIHRYYSLLKWKKKSANGVFKSQNDRPTEGKYMKIHIKRTKLWDKNQY